VKFFAADHPDIQYTGRIDFSNPKLPRFWAAGVYIQFKFKGPSCAVILNDEVLWGTSHNYLEIAVDGQKPYKIQLHSKTDTLTVAKGLSRGEHIVTICKNTEALIGYLEFAGVQCEKLLPLPAKPERRIEFIGNSITCGTGSDLTPIACDKGQWYDQHNAYYAYGPTVARKLKAQYHLTSESGIGLMHSCCDKPYVMPQVFDKMNFSANAIPWDFSRYTPDIVTVCLGQNDGVQDSVKFSQEYIDFIKTLRSHYPAAQIVCLTSPMADETLKKAMKNYLTGIVQYANQHGDKKVSRYFFSRSFNSGCGGHPDLHEHIQIAAELSEYIESLMKWK
ncbi:MAG TPA: SGNH/GDSL hydrolase family protein, partial [Ohtaekwangia sp.]|uniref:SGNH/GDSL hydrolase family protein n=1 Tax=Ohtaekwangia sp. TaxID=2066019 RepID=UPI002F951D63